MLNIRQFDVILMHVTPIETSEFNNYLNMTPCTLKCVNW